MDLSPCSSLTDTFIQVHIPIYGYTYIQIINNEINLHIPYISIVFEYIGSLVISK